jgi:hypothetical protein
MVCLLVDPGPDLHRGDYEGVEEREMGSEETYLHRRRQRTCRGSMPALTVTGKMGARLG